MSTPVSAAHPPFRAQNRKQAMRLVRQLVLLFSNPENGAGLLEQGRRPLMPARVTPTRKGKRAKSVRFPVAVQEACFAYWTQGRLKPAVRQGSTHKVGYGQVFAYYRRELGALGVTSVELFTRALGARSDRIRRG